MVGRRAPRVRSQPATAQTPAQPTGSVDILRSVTVLSRKGHYLVGFAGKAGPAKYGTAEFAASIIDKDGQLPPEAYRGVANDVFFLEDTPLDYERATALVSAAAAEGVYPPACPDITARLTIEGYHVVGLAKVCLSAA